MLVPIFDLLPDATLVVFEGDGAWSIPGSPIMSCGVRVEFKWSVGTFVHVQFEDEGKGFGLEDTAGVLRLSDGSELSNLVMLNETTASLNASVVGDPDASLDKVVFSVCNFVPYLHQRSDQELGLQFIDDRWHIDLEQVSNARDRIREVRLKGGGAVTHVGSITARDRSPFTWTQVEETFRGFGHFLNWAASDRVPILFPVGIAGDSPVVQVWGDPRRQLGRTGLRWFSAHHPETLPSMWSHFADLWAERDWRAALTIAGELYSDSHHGLPLELRIVTAQAALEVLAWQWLTRVEGMDPDKVDSENADWRIRRMLTSMRVPIHISSSLKALVAVSNGHDGPKTIAVVRSKVVHPKEGADTLDIPNEAKLDAWRLSLWYIEVALMKLCGWNGPYLDRTQPLPIWEGTVNYPPWTASASSD